MEWYYADQGRQTGPVSDAELDRLVKAGKILPATLVWNAGMTNWRPYGEAQRSAAAAPVPPPQSGGTATRCAECGKAFPEDEMVRYGEARVCAGCKAVFFQRLKEGGGIAGALDYAGFWIRWGAKILDGLILLIPTLLIAVAMGWATWKSLGLDGLSMMINIFQFLQLFISIPYNIFFVGRYGATPGKMIANIKVVAPDGGKIGYGRACGRAFAEILSSLICSIGYIIAAFDEEKRTLHDRICDTRVVKK